MSRLAPLNAKPRIAYPDHHCKRANALHAGLALRDLLVVNPGMVIWFAAEA
jgi:hypothetical protein